MVKSMTGFGRCVLEEELWTQIWEIRSVNNKHLDIRWKIPAHTRIFEPLFEKVVRQKSSRGRLEISLHLQNLDSNKAYDSLNYSKLSIAINSLSKLANLRGESFYPDYNAVLSNQYFWGEQHTEADESMEPSLEKGLLNALDDWNESRKMEGLALKKDLNTRLLHIEEWLLRITERAPDIKSERFALIKERANIFMEQSGYDLDEGRFLQETIHLLDKLDVSEELTRLQIHLERIHELLELGKEVGRKIDFTIQEAFREITTCGNKIQDIQVARLVVDIKNELEKCREQVQNIE